MIAYWANPSLRKKLVRAKLKPINTEPQPPHQYHHRLNQIIPSTYSKTLHKILETRLNDTTKNADYVNKHKILCYKHGKTNQNPNRPAASTPILQLPFKKHSVLNHMPCQYTNCGAQYVGYTMRELNERLFKHKTTHESPLQRRIKITYHSNLMYKYLHQAPTNEPNPDIWLKQKEYYWICKVGTLTKIQPKRTQYINQPLEYKHD